MKSNRFYQLMKSENFVNLAVLIGIVFFLLSYFKPDLLLSITTTSGGDTASHYYPTKFMRDYLLPNGKIVGWSPGWYAGFPMFQFYFPPLFALAALMSYLIPLEISFKIVTVLGTFLLPLLTFFGMRLMKFKFPIPIIAAIFTLFLLFNEGNSMWGGNIPSTLAGEFSYSFSLSLTILFFGFLYQGMETRKHALTNSILVAAITFSHVYTMLFSLFSSVFFLLEKKFRKLIQNLAYLIKVYAIGFLIIGFWLVPFALKISYTTPYNFTWAYGNARKEILPDILLPAAALAVFGSILAVRKRDRRILFMLFSILVSSAFYFLSSLIGVVDIRFIPFIQLMITVIAAYGLNELMDKIGRKSAIPLLIPFIVLIVSIIWVNHNTTYIAYWIKWNYEGFENKTMWNAYHSVNTFLKGSYKDPRVIFEHSDLYNSAGTPRAFESLPLFSGRSTYEGLYMQSSISAPFIFYFQSEISQSAPCPFPQWHCTSYNSTKAARHLEMFNVEYVIAVTDKVKNDLGNSSLYESAANFEPYEIFKLKANPNRYVTVPKYQPVAFETKDWKVDSYEWFKREDLLDIPLVFTNGRTVFPYHSSGLDDIPKIPLNNDCNIKEDFGIEQISFSTDCIGKPHIISVSYYPNWKVEGADGVYLVSPSFMLVIPKQKNVRLYYGETGIDLIGRIFSYVGILLIFLIILSRNQKFKRYVPRYIAS
jgi:hypothetical protein